MIWDLKKYSNNTAAVDKGNTFTYQQLFDDGEKLASQINKRCLVFSLCRNTYGSLLGYVTFLNHNIVPLMIDANLNNELLETLLESYKPQYIWAPKDCKQNLVGELVFEDWEYQLIKTIFDKEYPMNEQLALLLTTSGSTGSPKLVRQTYENILCNTKSIIEYLGIDSMEVSITTLPMNYTYGLSIINTHLFAGAKIVLTEQSLFSREFWNLFNEEKITSFGGVPYTYEMLDKIRFFRMNLPYLKTMTQAGGKILPELHKKFAQFALDNNKKFIVMYGQTEATARMAYLPSDKSLEKYGSMGVPIPGGKFSLIDENNNIITEPEVPGELVYEGKNVTLGYALCGEDLSKGDENHGRLVTGDIAKFDSDGFFYIVGRKKRFLKMFGKRVNLDEVERLIKSHYEGLECACAGKDDAMHIFINDTNKVAEIRSFVGEKININPAGIFAHYIESIPKNESGKTLYKELDKYYGF